MSAAETAPDARQPRSVQFHVLRAVIVLVVVVAVGGAVMEFVEKVDWGEMVDAALGVELWQYAVLVVALLVRQVLNSTPLVLFLEDLTIGRATAADQAATLVSMVAPPPSDIVLRLKIYSGWGIVLARGLAASTLNTLAFYINRLMVPLVGLGLMVALGKSQPSFVTIALTSVAAGLGLLVGATLAVRDAGSAERIGRLVGRLVARFRSSVDPEDWATRVLEFRNRIADKYTAVLPKALVALFVMTVADAGIVLLAVRFAGVPASALPALVVLGGFLVLFPMTIAPFQGLGLLDSALLAAYVATAGDGWEPEILAGMAIYRIVTLGGPFLMGLTFLTATGGLRGIRSGATEVPGADS